MGNTWRINERLKGYSRKNVWDPLILCPYWKLLITWLITNFKKIWLQPYCKTFCNWPFSCGVADSNSFTFDPNLSSLRYLFHLFYLYFYLLTVLRISLHWKLPCKLSANHTSVLWRSQQRPATRLQCILSGVFTVPYYITVLYIIMNQSSDSQATHFNHV